LELGHRRIDCLNTQACDQIIEGRIAAWKSFISKHKIAGQLHSLLEFRPVDSGYQLVKNRLMEGKSIGSALVCTTAPAALGAMRAFYDAGIKLGRNVSVCAVNDEGLGAYLIPSLTCLQSPPRAPYLEKAVDWILNGEWTGPLLIQPDDVPLFLGDSTGPAPAGGGQTVSRQAAGISR
jgi:DNA-binding LacI/PurR family transcriptional regulator